MDNPQEIAAALRHYADQIEGGAFEHATLDMRSDLAVRLPAGERYIQQRPTGWVNVTLRALDLARVGEDW